jgi:hypothetical protein
MSSRYVMVAFYRCVVYLFPLLDFLECRIICFVVSELLFLPAMVAILLVGLRILCMYMIVPSLFVFSSFMYFIMWGFLICL